MRTRSWKWAASTGLFGSLVLVAGVCVADDFEKVIAHQPAETRLDSLLAVVATGNVTKELYFHLGNAYYETGRPADAANAFGKAVEIDSTYFKAMVNLALMYDEQEEWGKAIATFERAAEVEPDNPDVFSHMGNTYYAQRKYSRAMDLYRQALSIDADATHALYSMGVAFADAGIFREAVKYWSRVAELEQGTDLGSSAAENVELLQKYLIPTGK